MTTAARRPGAEMTGKGRRQCPRLFTSDREEAEAWAPLPNDVCISITTPVPGGRAAQLRDGWQAVCRLAFDDVYPEMFDGLTIEQIGALEADGGEHTHRVTLMTDADAEVVVAFMDQHRAAGRLLVHCEAGVSRSVSVAMAVAICYRREPWRPRWMRSLPRDGRLAPNPHVYHAVCRAFQRLHD